MCKYRTIKGAYEEIKLKDADTALTLYRIRKMVTAGEIPAKKAGNKYIIDLDELEKHLNNTTSARVQEV